ncbi:ADP-ribose glycohydrolase MACROD1, partial [Pseudolycoriella hygida]
MLTVRKLFVLQLQLIRKICVTSSRKMSDWEKEKSRYLNMPIDEKRKHYKCGDDYETLSNIPNWSEYVTTDEGKKKLATASTAVTSSDDEESHDKSEDGEDAATDQTKSDVETYTKNDKFNEKISIFTGDITCLEIDAIVNAANSALKCGGGVDRAIHKAADRSLLQEECEFLDGCDTGDAKITGGYKLPAKYVIHTVGPRGTKPVLLGNCYRKSMDLLKEHELESIAFPCISTGIYGYPNEKAAEVALKTIRKWLEENEYSSDVKRIIFCLFLQRDVKIYHKLLPIYFPIGRFDFLAEASLTLRLIGLAAFFLVG